jgi:hypothetical protein
LVINHRQADLSDAAPCLMSNHLHWQAHGLPRIRRHRWPVEVDHEEGNADGLDQYQVRDVHALSRPIALVAVTYSLLRAAQHEQALLHKLQRRIKMKLDGAAGSCRRHTQAQAPWALATCIATALSQGRTLSELMEPLVTALCYEAERHARFPKLRRNLIRENPVKWRGVVCTLPMERSGLTRLKAFFASFIALQKSSE